VLKGLIAARGGTVLRVLGLLLCCCCLSLLPACSPDALKQVEVNPAGAVRLPAEEYILLRAYRPDISIELNRLDGAPARFTVMVQNMAAEYAQVTLSATPGRQEASVTRRIISDTEIALDIEGGEGKQIIELFTRPADTGGPVTFAVVGDSQGRNDTLAVALDQINQSEAAFLIHLGDFTPSGQEGEYLAFLETLQHLAIPCYTVPGNHDIKGNGAMLYQNLLAPSFHYFDYRGLRLVFLDSSTLELGEAQLAWLEDLLAQGDRGVLLFQHAPPVDPRGKGHALLDPGEAQRFLALAAGAGSAVKGMFFGHIHIYHAQVEDGIACVISGGGGASLYAPPDEGGYHHYTLVTVTEEGSVRVEPCPVEPPARSLDISCYGRKGELEITAAELEAMSVISGQSCFQNIYGNFRGEGTYRGVPVSRLVEAVGGMEPGDQLLVYSGDGYVQAYAYENVYPREAGWYGYQGDMILAIEYNGTTPPEWEDGYRIVFLPEDGVYDNSDCEHSSAPGQGWHLYQSAGSRWVRMVTRLEVLP